jgi:hypothetical protein
MGGAKAAFDAGATGTITVSRSFPGCAGDESECTVMVDSETYMRMQVQVAKNSEMRAELQLLKEKMEVKACETLAEVEMLKEQIQVQARTAKITFDHEQAKYRTWQANSNFQHSQLQSHHDLLLSDFKQKSKDMKDAEANIARMKGELELSQKLRLETQKKLHAMQGKSLGCLTVQELDDLVVELESASKSVGNWMLARDDVERQVPDAVCPITQKLLIEPVDTIDGFTFEKASIEKWFALRRENGQHLRTPLSRVEISSAELKPNNTVKKIIQRHVEQRWHELQSQASAAKASSSSAAKESSSPEY